MGALFLLASILCHQVLAEEFEFPLDRRKVEISNGEY
jgi:hypothetical protein